MPSLWHEIIYDDMLHQRRTRTFCDIFPELADFTSDVTNSQIPITLTAANQKTLYYLLYARYGNSHIASMDEEQFKYKMFSIIFMYGPSWEKELALQKTFRELTDDQLVQGAKTIFNHAHNPGTAPDTSTLEELTYIDDQNTANYKKSYLDAYYLLEGLLKQDVTESFIRRFESLFIKFVSPEPSLIYVTQEEE